MSSVILNRHGIDHVGFTLTSSGSNVAQCMLNDLLLNPGKEYVLRVTELNAPMQGLPLFGYGTDGSIRDAEFFRIRRRVSGSTLAAVIVVGNANIFDTSYGPSPFQSNLGTKGLDGVVHFTAASFIATLGKHANNFTQKQDVIGTGNPVPQNGVGSAGSQTEYLRIRLNADGAVELIGTSIFWENYFLQFTDYGLALLGLQAFADVNNIVSVTTRADGTLEYNMFDLAANTVLNTTTAPNHTPTLDTIRLVGSYSLFKNLEHRYFVSLETDLMVQQSMKVVDGRQTTDRSICKAFFPTSCKVILESQDGELREDVDFELESRVGQHSFVKKTNPSRQWVSLQTSYDLRFYRFHLYVTYRFFDTAGKFVFSRIKYPIGQDDSWSMALEFVSKL